MKLIAPQTPQAREALCAQLTAALPPELRKGHRVAILKGRFGWYAKVVRFGPLRLPERLRRRHAREVCVVQNVELWGPGS